MAKEERTATRANREMRDEATGDEPEAQPGGPAYTFTGAMRPPDRSEGETEESLERSTGAERRRRK